MIEIKHKSTGKVMLRIDRESLSGGSFTGLDLLGADLRNHDFSNCKITSSNFSEADMRGTKWTGCKMQNCVLKRTDLSGSTLSGADLSDNIFDVAKLLQVQAVGTKFRHSKINGAELGGGNFQKADFFFAELRSDCQGACMLEANLFGADLTSADFTRADLRKSNMTDATILRANFTYAKMEDCIGTNGQPWGFTVRNAARKRAWWQIWGNAAM